MNDFNKDKQLNLDEFVFMKQSWNESGFFNHLSAKRTTARPSIQNIVEDNDSLLMEDRGDNT